MSPVHADMLKRFGQFSRNLIYFTSQSPYFAAMAPAVAQRNLDELVAMGLITKIKTGYKLTEKGRLRMDGPGDAAAPAPRVGNWVPPKWEPARGAAAEEHRQYKSLPVEPQIRLAGR